MIKLNPDKATANFGIICRPMVTIPGQPDLTWLAFSACPDNMSTIFISSIRSIPSQASEGRSLPPTVNAFVKKEDERNDTAFLQVELHNFARMTA